MKNSEYLDIDGLVVSKDTPFQMYEAFPRTDSKLSSGNLNRRRDEANLKDFVNNLLQQNIQDYPEVNEGFMHFRSASSLRDKTLFSPPPSLTMKQQQITQPSPEQKKTLFINEFTSFEYVKQPE